MAPEQRAIDVRREVAFRRQDAAAELRNGHEPEQRPVPNHDRDGCHDLRPPRGALRQRGDGRKDDRDALKYARDAKGRQIQRRRRFDCVQQQAEQKEGRRAPEDVMAEPARRSTPPFQRERHRGPHREQQKREDEVGRRPAGPHRMVERRIHRVPRAWRADEDHRGDRRAAKDVE